MTIAPLMYCCAERPAEKTGWQPPTCTPPTAGMLIQKYMDMRDFTYPIATASGKAQRLFDIVGFLFPVALL